jgi:pilus assembly protein CpaF
VTKAVVTESTQQQSFTRLIVRRSQVQILAAHRFFFRRDGNSNNERILLIEDTAEIQKPNVLRFEAGREQSEFPVVTIRDLLKATLRHRSDCTVLGEIRGGEAFDLLQLLITGHSGTIPTVHGNSALEGISRFTTCVLQSGIEFSYLAIKRNIADSLNVVVHIERRPGRRFIAEALNLRGFAVDDDRYEFESVCQYTTSTPP